MKRKLIAPIVVTILVVAYYALYFGVIIAMIPEMWAKIALGAVPPVLACVMIGVCVQRINEIRSGEEDDLGKY